MTDKVDPIAQLSPSVASILLNRRGGGGHRAGRYFHYTRHSMLQLLSFECTSSLVACFLYPLIKGSKYKHFNLDLRSTVSFF